MKYLLLIFYFMIGILIGILIVAGLADPRFLVVVGLGIIFLNYQVRFLVKAHKKPTRYRALEKFILIVIGVGCMTLTQGIFAPWWVA